MKEFGTIKKTLGERFKCESKKINKVMDHKETVRMVDIEPLAKSDEFRKLLGYLNTAKGQERKSGEGHIA